MSSKILTLNKETGIHVQWADQGQQSLSRYVKDYERSWRGMLFFCPKAGYLNCNQLSAIFIKIISFEQMIKDSQNWFQSTKNSSFQQNSAFFWVAIWKKKIDLLKKIMERVPTNDKQHLTRRYNRFRIKFYFAAFPLKLEDPKNFEPLQQNLHESQKSMLDC
jgi:hypothetical protein